MHSIAPSHPTKTARHCLLTLLAFLTLPFVCRSTAVADEPIALRLDGYYTCDKPLLFSSNRKSKVKWEYIRFYGDGVMVREFGESDRGYEDQWMDGFDKDKSRPGLVGTYTREGNTIQMATSVESNIPEFHAQGRITENGLELEQIVGRQTYTQPYHFVLPPPPPAPDPQK